MCDAPVSGTRGRTGGDLAYRDRELPIAEFLARAHADRPSMGCAAWLKFLRDFGVTPALLPRDHAVLVFGMGADPGLAPVLVR